MSEKSWRKVTCIAAIVRFISLLKVHSLKSPSYSESVNQQYITQQILFIVFSLKNEVHFDHSRAISSHPCHPCGLV